MGRVVKAVIYLMVFSLIGLAVYAYLGDLSPVQTEVTVPVVLNAQ